MDSKALGTAHQHPRPQARAPVWSGAALESCKTPSSFLFWWGRHWGFLLLAVRLARG